MALKPFLAACAVAALPVGAAQAGAITTYTDSALFTGDVGPVTLEDFGSTAYFPISSGVLDENTTDAGIPAGLIAPGVTFSTPVGPGNFFNIDNGAGYAGGFLDSLVSSGRRALTISFDGAVEAFGFDTNLLMGAFDITVTFADGGSYTGGGAAAGFYGFASSSRDIVSAVLQGPTAPTFNYDIDNMLFTAVGEPETAPSDVPGPAAAPLLLGAAALLVAAARRRA